MSPALASQHRPRRRCPVGTLLLQENLLGSWVIEKSAGIKDFMHVCIIVFFVLYFHDCLLFVSFLPLTSEFIVKLKQCFCKFYIMMVNWDSWFTGRTPRSHRGSTPSDSGRVHYSNSTSIFFFSPADNFILIGLPSISLPWSSLYQALIV